MLFQVEGGIVIASDLPKIAAIRCWEFRILAESRFVLLEIMLIISRNCWTLPKSRIPKSSVLPRIKLT